MTITRADLKNSTMSFVYHVDFSDFFENHFRNDVYPRLTCVVAGPRRHRSKVMPSKRFFVDGVEVFGCRELLERLNTPQLAVVGSEAA